MAGLQALHPVGIAFHLNATSNEIAQRVSSLQRRATARGDRVRSFICQSPDSFVDPPTLTVVSSVSFRVSRLAIADETGCDFARYVVLNLVTGKIVYLKSIRFRRNRLCG